MKAIHVIFGEGEIKSPPIQSRVLDQTVFVFKPDNRDFEVTVPEDELS